MPPRRRLPARVYRRRRAVVLLVVLVLVVAVVLVLRPWAGGADGSTEGVSSAPFAVPTPTPTGAASAAPVDCSATSVVVTAVTDATSYGPDQNPRLSLSLANVSNTACVINAGTSQQVFTITSGSDRVWISTDCQSKPADLKVLLQAGQSVTGGSISWDRTRSSPETCSGGRAAVAAGGAGYQLSVSVAGLSSRSPAQFTLK
ncbi:hypothetical protein C5C66_10180 [Rathayibacter toxicus]|nr:hypothetical protein APU90_06745 [Rathayibacter toxicus]PPG20828.1 hypothetical protein C5D15_10175 [Rathayibacter toxicus]PPG45932.1 hypothetical protein C5D16_10145 [Rathayibacter toxicus]PPH62510.1 hypothetical protein C5D13_10240 [Rathayibacter toxicus]PPH67120.1 hypothetical protein C5D01_10220 [Rathayibacter toxicus]